MFKWLKKLFQRKEQTSCQIARSRLKNILSSDRTSISNSLFEKMKEEILNCICKYAEIDQERVVFEINRGEKNKGLILSTTIPIFSYKEPVAEALAS